MNVLITRVHGVIDYLTGALLIRAPYLFGFATQRHPRGVL